MNVGNMNGDGDTARYHPAGGRYPGDKAHNALCENPGNGRHWVTLRLAGTQANRSAIGARLMLTVEGSEGERRIAATVGSGGSFGGNSLQVELGIGEADDVPLLEVSWPGSGLRQTFRDLPADRLIQIEEGGQPRVSRGEAIRLSRPP